MTFAYDARAALARLRIGEATPATVATPATEAAGLSQLSQLSQGVALEITPSPAPVADLDAFEERAAIREHDGGETRAEAEAGAAGELGFASLVNLYAAAAEGWRRNLEALAFIDPSAIGRDCLAAALRFVSEGWAERAAALGWPEVELFGLCASGRWARLDRLGAAFSRLPVREVTAERILYAPSLPLWRGRQADGAALAWGGGAAMTPRASARGLAALAAGQAVLLLWRRWEAWVALAGAAAGLR